jgi:hypothetical protein
MLSRRQQILLKRAMREAGLEDTEYREALAIVCGCRSSTDPEMTDRDADKVLAYFEAIHWRKVDRGELQPSRKVNAVFRQRGYWAGKNTNEQTSRDRWAANGVSSQIASLEGALGRLGFGPQYCATIRENVTRGDTDNHAQFLYKAALERTLRAKKNKTLRAAAR